MGVPSITNRKKVGLQLMGLLCLAFLTMNMWQTVSEGRLRSIMAAVGITISFLAICFPLLKGTIQRMGKIGIIFWAAGLAISILAQIFISGEIRI